MQNASYFIKDKALFGSYPTQEAVNSLEKIGVRYFVNLTRDTEKKISPYKTQYTSIIFPIPDHRTPTNKIEFSRFIIKLSDIILSLKSDERLYLHCKGGHGRSGIVVSVILCYLFGLSPQQAMEYTSKYHSRRPIMRDKWRKVGAPQSWHQKNFVYHFCKPIYIYKVAKIEYCKGFSIHSKHRINVPSLGSFSTLANILEEFIKIYGEEVYNSKISKILFNLLKLKLDQHTDIKENLLNTGLSSIIYRDRTDLKIGTDENNVGENLLGKQLVKLRSFYLR